MVLPYSQKTNFRESINKQVQIENEIKAMLQGKVPAPMLVYYIIFAKQVVKKAEKYKGNTLYGELNILDNLWAGRGLNSSILKEIKAYYVPSYPTEKFFILDESLLDGPDVLA